MLLRYQRPLLLHDSRHEAINSKRIPSHRAVRILLGLSIKMVTVACV